MEEQVFITPNTTLSQLKVNFPQAYNFVFDNVDYLSQIKNSNLISIMSDSINISMIAEYSKIPLHQLINKLREVSGVIINEVENNPRPQWLKSESISNSLDAREIIMNGGHPLDQVMEEVKKLDKNKIFELITPFAPDPLINIFRSQGFEVWVEQESVNLYKTYIKNKE
mgnify:CR=1 FL=1